MLQNIFLIDGSKVYFSGDFDSGNLEKTEQLSPFVVNLTIGSIGSGPLSTRLANQLEKPSFILKHTGSKIVQ
jgi:hypothetical protein